VEKGRLALRRGDWEGRERQDRDISVLVECHIELEYFHGRAGESEVVGGRCEQ